MENAEMKNKLADHMQRLSHIVDTIDGNDGLALEEALKLFEEGVVLSQKCQKILTETRRKVEILTKNCDEAQALRPFETQQDRGKNSE